MPQSIVTLLVALVIGLILAIISLSVNFPVGWIGGLSFISWIIISRQSWTRMQETNGLEPSAPERALRFYAVGTALLFGHMMVGIMYPGIDLHVGQGNYLAIDSWSMMAAMLMGAIIVRQDNKITDERGAFIIAHGTKIGFITLISILTIFSFVLGFLPPNMDGIFTRFMIGNILIAIIVVSLLVKYIVQLIEYARDTHGNFAVNLDE